MMNLTKAKIKIRTTAVATKKRTTKMKMMKMMMKLPLTMMPHQQLLQEKRLKQLIHPRSCLYKRSRN
jgi:hypothetical protein